MDAKSKFQRKKKNNAKGNKGLTSPKQRAKKKQKLKKKKKNQAARKKAKNKKVIGERAQKNKGWSFLKTLKVYFGKHDPIVFEPGVMDIVEMLNFNQLELRKMKYVFEKADIDMMGEVDYDELMELVQHPRSPYTDALMSLIDPEGTGIITFQGFFQIIATYSMYTEEDILRFAFTTFDKDSSGTIDEEEFMDLCKTINNANPAFPANFKGALQQFDRNDDGLIDYEEFKQINRRFPMVLYPAFKLQNQMHLHVLGLNFWRNKMRQKRLEEQILEYQRSHGGALPPVPLGKRMCQLLTCCCRRSNKVRTDRYEAPKKRTPKKRRKKQRDSKHSKGSSSKKKKESDS